MTDKTPYIKKFKEVLIQKGHKVTDEEVHDYFERLYAFYSIALENTHLLSNEDISLEKRQDSENITSTEKGGKSSKTRKKYDMEGKIV